VILTAKNIEISVQIW